MDTVLRMRKYETLVDAYGSMQHEDAYGNIAQFKSAVDVLRKAYEDYIQIEPVNDAFRKAIEFYIKEAN